ncbi:MAG: tetratricopeptide repeat protein [Ruminiclostridium sp.]
MNLKFNNHKDNKNEKKQIWMYALILFAGAFIILLLTAYSQVKFQNNISDYQNKLTSEEKAKINVVTDFNAAVKENKRLTTELESLRSKLVESEQKIATEEAKGIDLESKVNNTMIANNLLFVAYEYYIQEDYMSCAITLKYDINTEFLSMKATQSYNDLILKSYEKASSLLYRDGYKNYRNENYADAILSFNRSIDFSQKNEYYIDDAYYYLARCYYKTLKFDEAKTLINSFVANYPKSAFIQDMKALYSKMA